MVTEALGTSEVTKPIKALIRAEINVFVDMVTLHQFVFQSRTWLRRNHFDLLLWILNSLRFLVKRCLRLDVSKTTLECRAGISSISMRLPFGMNFFLLTLVLREVLETASVGGKLLVQDVVNSAELKAWDESLRIKCWPLFSS